MGLDNHGEDSDDSSGVEGESVGKRERRERRERLRREGWWVKKEKYGWKGEGHYAELRDGVLGESVSRR